MDEPEDAGTGQQEQAQGTQEPTQDPNRSQDVQVTCPNCGKGFFHRIGHAFKEVGKTGLEIALSNLGAFKNE